MLWFDQKNYAAATPHLARAVALDPTDSRSYNYLGICYSRASQFPKAIASYQKAIQLTPDLAEAHLNLSYAYQQINRTSEAQTEAQTACHLEERYCKFAPKN